MEDPAVSSPYCKLEARFWLTQVAKKQPMRVALKLKRKQQVRRTDQSHVFRCLSSFELTGQNRPITESLIQTESRWRSYRMRCVCSRCVDTRVGFVSRSFTFSKSTRTAGFHHFYHDHDLLAAPFLTNTESLPCLR